MTRRVKNPSESAQVAGWLPARFIHEGRVHVPTEASLSVIGVTLALAVAFSIAFPQRK